MENKIQELTDKIYREGVEKGNEEAQKLIAKAQEEAQENYRGCSQGSGFYRGYRS